jgi:hydroxyacylglutathione hydrolase
MTMALTPLDPSRCIELIGDGAVLIDLRDSAAFGEGHPPRAINVRYDDRHLGERVALIVGGVPRVLLLAVEPAQLENAANQLAAATFDVVGVASDSSAEWADSGSPWVALPSIVTGDLADGPEQPQYHVLDVREPMEWAVGHVPGAQLIALGDVHRRVAEVPDDRDVAIICEAGVRSSSAASVLQAAGLTRLVNVADGTAGWRTAGRPMQTTNEAVSD